MGDPVLQETLAALEWALRRNGGECPVDDQPGYVKAMEAVLSARAAVNPAVCRVCGKLADLVPGRCIRHPRKSDDHPSRR